MLAGLHTWPRQPGPRARKTPCAPAWSSLTTAPATHRRTARSPGTWPGRVAYLDAPVGGAGARGRTVTTMAGGDRKAYEKCEDPHSARRPASSRERESIAIGPARRYGAFGLPVTAPVPTATRRRAKPAVSRTPRPRTSTPPPAKSCTATAWQPNEDATGKPCRSGADGQDAAAQAAAVGLGRVTRPVALRQFTTVRSGTRRVTELSPRLYLATAARRTLWLSRGPIAPQPPPLLPTGTGRMDWQMRKGSVLPAQGPGRVQEQRRKQ